MRRVLTACVAAIAPNHQPSLPSVAQQRSFWNPFKKDKVSEAVSTLAANQVSQNEKLIDSSLEILRLNTSLELTDAEQEKISDVIALLFNDFSKKPSAQFDAVYDALCIPTVRGNKDIRTHFFVVLETILPEMLYVVFDETDNDLFELTTDQQVFVLRRLVHFLLGDIDLFASDTVEIDVGSLFAEIYQELPFLGKVTSFVELEKNAEDMILRARLFALLGEVCAAFDTEKTGLVSLSEFEASLINVLGEEEGKKMIADVKPDDKGNIRYHQLSAIMTKPRQKR